MEDCLVEEEFAGLHLDLDCLILAKQPIELSTHS